jgi:rhodanese-related sulfurtransferase
MEISTILNILAYGLIAWFLFTRLAPIRGLKNLSADEFSRQMGNEEHKILIDVREHKEYKAGYIPGAVNIPLSQLKRRMTEIPKDKQVYLYCRSGMRSKQAARILSKKGYSDLAHLQGGILTWSGKISK